MAYPLPSSYQFVLAEGRAFDTWLRRISRSKVVDPLQGVDVVRRWNAYGELGQQLYSPAHSSDIE